MSASSEDILVVERVLAGDTGAFRRIVERYRKPILSFIYNITRDAEHVEDLGQEVFLKAFRSLADFDVLRGAAFSTWLFAIARNESLDHGRRVKRPSPHAEALRRVREPSTEDRAAEARNILEDTLEALPEEQRLAVEWVFIQGMSYEEAARLEGVSVGTLSSRLARAKAKLQDCLRGAGG